METRRSAGARVCVKARMCAAGDLHGNPMAGGNVLSISGPTTDDLHVLLTMRDGCKRNPSRKGTVAHLEGFEPSDTQFSSLALPHFAQVHGYSVRNSSVAESDQPPAPHIRGKALSGDRYLGSCQEGAQLREDLRHDLFA